jgi:hypothetical protein
MERCGVRLDGGHGKADDPGHMLQRVLFLAGVLSTIAAIACSTDDAAKKGTAAAQTAAAEVSGPTRLADDGFDASCCSKREFDLNKDGKPDAYQFVKVVDGDQVIVRKENDVNFDGKIDLVRNLSDKGELAEERLDNDFDGRIDLVVFFEKGVIVRKEYDTNFDNKIDMWRYFDKGTIAREEADLNYDGKVDYWEYFEGGKLDRVGIDRDSDGNVDEWIQSQAEAAGG